MRKRFHKTANGCPSTCKRFHLTCRGPDHWEGLRGSRRPPAAHAWRDLRDECTRLYHATDEELAERPAKRREQVRKPHPVALTHLVQAGLLTRPRRGRVQITVRGKEVFAERPDRIDMQVLSRFDDYRQRVPELRREMP